MRKKPRMWSDRLAVELAIVAYEIWIARNAERDGIPPDVITRTQIFSEHSSAISCMNRAREFQAHECAAHGLNDNYLHDVSGNAPKLTWMLKRSEKQ